ncbi:hypothetical protein GCM10023191_007820 [Actinoallomurus oryzae]|uniref:Uncharacterized protein n=1 Tax=Actinoallomurus oryzae TaxID=502180 RepID=A0ABP8PB41_9ACTN
MDTQLTQWQRVPEVVGFRTVGPCLPMREGQDIPDMTTRPYVLSSPNSVPKPIMTRARA